jgi:AraC family transcriptional regulator
MSGSGGSPFIGACLRRVAVEGFDLGVWNRGAGEADVQPHGHDDAHVMLAVAGRYVTEAHGDDGASTSRLIFNPRQTFHRDRFEGTGGIFFSLAISADRTESARDLGLPTSSVLVAEAPAHALTDRLMRECVAWRPDSTLTIESLCLELLGALGTRGDPDVKPPRWLRRACALLREAGPGKVGEIATEVGVHPIHLTRTFRRHLRCTPGEFQRRHRLASAAELLARTSLDLVEVALSSGFADQSHLTHRFTAQYGLSPGTFRRLTA